ncbi:MAG: AEC family transporter [Bacteroidetes bacterium]|nr:AEC family transporter [Bacteroidota bacterium]
MIDDLFFIINTVFPVFLLVIVGIILKWKNIVDDNFVKITSQFVFMVSLPVLIFLKLYNVDLESTIDVKMITVVIGGIFIMYAISLFIAKRFKLKPENEGVFIQGSFRNNDAIVGLAIILRMFGTDALSKASFLLLFALPLYNLLGVISLTLPHRLSKNINLKKTVIEILANPFMISIILAIPFSVFQIELHGTIETTGNYIAQISLPLALIGIGSSINIKSIKEASGLAFGAPVLKNIVSPLVVISLCFMLDIFGQDLGILFIIFSAPTAIASFIMASSMKGNLKLAGNIVIISTLGSIFTMTFGLFCLRYFRII